MELERRDFAFDLNCPLSPPCPRFLQAPPPPRLLRRPPGLPQDVQPLPPLRPHRLPRGAPRGLLPRRALGGAAGRLCRARGRVEAA